MSSNNLIIGLGGTGGKVIAAMRRLMYQHHDSPEPKNIALDYLYIDTSKRETELARHGTGLDASDKRWRYLGHSVQLARAQVVHLSNSSFGTIVKNSENYPRIASWLGDADVWNRYWDSQKGEMEAAGQIRRFGRIVLAQNLDEATRGLNARIQALREKNNITNWRFHIVAGLAGGTGSGSFLDIVRLVQKAAVGTSAKIYLYTVLPEAEQTKWSNGNYHANGYAALKELNAMQVERLKLADLETGSAAELPSVKASWIITNQNDEGIRFDVDQTLPQLTAEAIYQVYVASGEATIQSDEGAGPAGNAANERAWMDVPSGENAPIDMNNEKDDPSNPREGPWDRFNNFVAFGIKSVAVPVEEVQEYSSLVFLRQFILQSLNNSWIQGAGFTDSARELDYSAIAKDTDRWESWLFSDKHLKLETGSMPSDERWRALREEFARGINGPANEIQSNVKDSASWPRAIEDQARDFYENAFRNSGVSKFYAGADRSRENRAKLIVEGRIAPDLFTRWIAGEYSIRNVLEVVREIQHISEERRLSCDENVARFAKAEDDLSKTIATLKSEYSKLGLIGGAIKGKKVFSQIVEAVIDFNTAKSQRAAFGYMSGLLATIDTHLEKLRVAVEQIKLRLDEAQKEVELAIASRVQGSEKNLAGSGQYKFYDPQYVRDVIGQLERNEDVQKAQVKALRAKLVELTGAEPSFESFAKKIMPGTIVSSLEEVATANALEALGNIGSDSDKVLGGSIVEKLAQEYANRPGDLQAFLSRRVAEAQPLVAVDISERNMTNPQWSKTVTVAFVPARGDCDDRLRSFHDLLTSSLQGAGAGNVEIVETSGQPERIVILSFLHRFPLRMLSNVKYLLPHYEQKMEGSESSLAGMMLHLEGDGTDLPSLYAANVDKYRKIAAPYWLIAQCLDMLKDEIKPDTGKQQAVFRYRDSKNYGDRADADMGPSVAEGTGTLSINNALLLIRVIKEELEKIIHVDDRAKLIGALGELRDQALTKAGDNTSNEKFKQVDEWVKSARAIVNS